VIHDQEPEPRDGEDASSEVALQQWRRELRALRPVRDALKLELAREKAERRLFGSAAPARIGRFVLLGEHASGGMGVVYGAYDPQLDRRVALKLPHPPAVRSPLTRERLLAEARALARLDHPNVVPIHDVVVIDDLVVLVMEWVEGVTLASWEAEVLRSWRELVATYRSAGLGLAAAHALGLIHRDFKPSNAILGAHGRVRILDFGLARLEDIPFESSHSTGVDPAPSTAPGLTATGEVLGTPAFMAPEQLAGEVATAASDQFSFCVALYRAVFGVLPYAGATVEEKRANLIAGRLAEPAQGRRPPRWLRAALARGLAAAPADRYPSMNALLEELGREHGWRRWRVPIALAGVAAALLAAVLAGRNASPIAHCDGAPAAIEPFWNARRSDQLARAFALQHGPRTSSVATAVIAGLDGYRAAWIRLHRAVCVDHRDGAQSSALLDLRMSCLRRRAEALDAAVVALLQVDADSLDRAREVVGRLPAIDDCGNRELLAATVEPPRDPATRARVAALQRALAAVTSLDHLGRSSEALHALRANQAAVTSIGYPPLAVEFGLAEGRMLLVRSDYAEAIVVLAEVEKLALAHGLLAPAIEAGARRIYCESMQSDDLATVLGRAELLEPLSRGLQGDRFARPLLLNNLGVLHQSMGQRALAQAAFAKASAAVATVREPDLELSAIDHNLAMLTREDDVRERLARGVWQRRRALVGAEHPLTLEALLSYGKFVRDPARALPLVAEACALYRQFHPDLLARRAHCGGYEGLLTSELGRPEQAAAAYQDTARLSAGTDDAYLRQQHLLAAAAASLERGQVRDARAAFETVLAGATGQDWWIRARAATARLGIARTWRAPEDPRAAIAHLEQAIVILEEVSGLTEDTEHKLRLALARMTLATLWRRRGRVARAAELAGLAAEYYRHAGSATYQERISVLEGKAPNPSR
jgi:eukaryotic-like serine/threonine-protein kinase